MRALERVGGPQWLFASWGMSCIRSEGEILRVAGWEMCVGFSLMASHVPCLSICFAHLGAASGESIGATRVVALVVEWFVSVVAGAGHLIVEQRFLVEVRGDRQCLDV